MASISQDAVNPEDGSEGRNSRRNQNDGGSASEAERQAGQPTDVAHIALDETGVRTEQSSQTSNPA